MTVAKIISGEDLYESLLFEDRLRANDPYTYFPDINGNYVVRNVRAENPDTEADYTWVHFSLKTQEMIGKEVFVYGGFNNFQLTDENKMAFNPQRGIYEAQILLKQGFYNYKYVVMDAEQFVNTTEIDGSFYPTENEYHVLIYYSKFGSKYDRVIGYGIGSSLNLKN